MSSASDFTASLTLALANLYKYFGPILMSIGTASCVLSLLVFTKKNLRKNPCSMYLIALNINYLLLIYTSIFFATLATGYHVDPTTYNLTFCRFRFYGIFLFDVISPCYVILASVDRILLTSPNALTRQRSTPRLAYICIIAVTIFWLIGHSHSLFLTIIIQLAPGYSICYFQPGVYITVLAYYSLFIKAILIPVLMILSGLWTVRNVRRIARITPAPAFTNTGTTANGGVRSIQSKDRQLIKILLVDTSIYIMFDFMVTIILIYQQLTPTPPQGSVQSAIQSFLFSLGVFSTYIPSCIGCYTNMLVSKTFRNEVKNILLCKQN